MKNNLDIVINKSTTSSRNKAAQGVAQWLRSDIHHGHTLICVESPEGFVVVHPYRDKTVTEAIGGTHVEAMTRALRYLIPGIQTPSSMEELLTITEKEGFLLEPNPDCSANQTGVIYNVMSVKLKKIQKELYG